MSREVLRQRTDVASPPRPDEGRHLPLKVRIRDGHLDDRLGATGGERLRDEGGCPPGERPPDPDGPLLLQGGNEIRQLLNPIGADIPCARRLLPDDVWYADHPHRQQHPLRSAADAPRGEGACFDQSCFAGLVSSPKPAITHAPPADLP